MLRPGSRSANARCRTRPGSPAHPDRRADWVGDDRITKRGATEPDSDEPGAIAPGNTAPGATAPGATAPGATAPGNTDSGGRRMSDDASGELRFDSEPWFTADLPGEADNGQGPGSRQVHGAAWSAVPPLPTAEPTLVAHSAEVAELLGIDPGAVDTPAFAEVFSGNRLLAGMEPVAANYGGHQFGNWAGQLGDGRAIAIAEVAAPGGHQTLQLKGAGPTPYSRRADGRAVLRSSVREFLCSEAMHHLGVPTTRALSLVTTGDQVIRDMLYDGHPAPEPGAVVCRVAPSFLRFGSYELPASRGEHDLLRQFVAHTIVRFFPHLLGPGAAGSSAAGTSAAGSSAADTSAAEARAAGPAAVAALAADLPPDLVVRWLAEVTDRTADLMVDWMRVGFVHGVMNTDNLSILGLTIDYGPYGWLEDFDPGWTPNTTDRQTKRYRYGQQPQIGLWNLVRLANALYPLVGEAEPLQEVLDGYAPRYQDGWAGAMADKLGLRRSGPVDEIGSQLLDLLPRTETDMTIFFRLLGELDPMAEPAAAGHSTAGHAATEHATSEHSTAEYATAEHATSGRSTAEHAMAGRSSDGHSIDRAEVAPLLEAYYRPEELTGDLLAATADWVRRYRTLTRAEQSTTGRTAEERRAAMHAVNPKYVLRNAMAQLAIDKAEVGDPSLVIELLDLLRRPFDEQPERHDYAAKRPEWARERVGCSMLSCSS